ncbi:MAG: hypothetical protein ACTS79_01555 [Arsenophonus sp. ET-KM2-MAG3]
MCVCVCVCVCVEMSVLGFWEIVSSSSSTSSSSSSSNRLGITFGCKYSYVCHECRYVCACH